MRRRVRLLLGGLLLTAMAAGSAFAQGQQPLTWQEVRDKFEAANPSLRAGQIGIDESRAQETTAYLRPNPNLTLTADQINPFPGGPDHGALAFFLPVASVNYLHERQHKRELRLKARRKQRVSRRQASRIWSGHSSSICERRSCKSFKERPFSIWPGKILLTTTRSLEVNRERYRAGGIAQVDLDRLELQRIQYESDLATAEVNLRTAKIQLLALLDDRTPVEQFDATGPFDFSSQLPPLDEIRQSALDTRQDLKAALQSVDRAKTDHRLAIADGSTDPTFGFDVGRNPPIDQYIGFNVSFPLRIFDRNQGEKKRTLLDIDRNDRLAEAARALVFSDVDSAYAALQSTVVLLQPYKDRYLQQALRVRDTISFSYNSGAASLLDFLNAQADYRSVQLNYLNLIASYLEAAGQLNMAVAREVIP